MCLPAFASAVTLLPIVLGYPYVNYLNASNGKASGFDFQFHLL